MSSPSVPVMLFEIVQPCYGTQQVEKTSDNKSPITCQPKYGILCLFEKRTQPTGAGDGQLLGFVRFIDLFCKCLPDKTMGEEIYCVTTEYLEQGGLSWKKIIIVCTDAAATMTGNVKGFISRIREQNQNSRTRIFAFTGRYWLPRLYPKIYQMYWTRQWT